MAFALPEGEGMKKRIAGIATIPVDEAEGQLAALYARLGGRREPAHIYQVHSLHPAALEAHAQLYRTVMFGPSPLSRVHRELVGTLVSQANGCHY